MNLLLDTHVFLWWCGNNPKLGKLAIDAIANSQNVVYVSVASAWEIAIKEALGRLKTPEPVEDAVIQNEFSPLGISFQHARTAGSLPNHHRDPFDRMLVAQAQVDELVFVTRDELIRPYKIKVLWI
ncbi:MAG: type II toxin-antitoxin system VapC family toxin [Candidatus Binatia bacterium]